MEITQEQFFLFVLKDLLDEKNVDFSTYGLDYPKDKNKIGSWIENMVEKKLIKNPILIRAGIGNEFKVVDLSNATITYDGEVFLSEKYSK